MFSWSRTALISNVTEITVIHVGELTRRNYKRSKFIFVYQKQTKHKTAASKITTKLAHCIYSIQCINSFLSLLIQ